MEKLNLTPKDELTSIELKKYQDSMRKQLFLARNNGYIPEDLSEDNNCGYVREIEQAAFYDFEDWQIRQDQSNKELTKALRN